MTENQPTRPFPGATACHALLERMDWTVSPLGHPASWPCALRANLNLVLDAAMPMAIAWGAEQVLLYNEAWGRLLGAAHPRALGRPFAQAWPEVWPALAPLLDRARLGEACRADDLALGSGCESAAGPARFAYFCSPVRDDEGAVAGTCSTLVAAAPRDLTRTLEQRVAERTAELERSKAHLLSLFRQTAAGIAETDLHMRIVRANDKYCEIAGRTPEAVIGMLPAELVHPDDLDANVDALREMLRTGRPVEIENRFLRPDGTAVWVAKKVAPIFEQGESAPSSILAVVVDITRRKEAEAQWRASTERLQLATEAASLAIWTWHVDQDTVTWENERMHDILGVPRDSEPINVARYIAEFAHPDDIEPYRQAIARSLETGAAYQYEGRFRRASDGALRWLEFTGQLHYDAAGRPQRMIGTAADITERKRVVEQLRSAQARLEATLEAGEIGTWLYDMRAYRMHADANMARLHGIDPLDAASASPRAYAEALDPADRAAMLASVDRVRATGGPFECVYRAGGRILHARGRVECENGVPVRMPGVVIDITRQTMMEQQLRTREQRYRTLLSSIDDGFCLVELVHDAAGRAIDHRVLEANPAFERHTGVVDAAGKTADQLAPGTEQYWNDLYQEVARSGQPVRVVQHNEALGRWFDVFVAKAEGAADDQVAILFRDVTAERRAEDDLRTLAADLSQANRRQNEFLATLAHELRNPLAPIRTGLDLMRLNPGNAASAARVRDMMERQVNHLIHLVNDLLDLTRIQSGKIELKRSRVVLQDVAAQAVEASMPLIRARRHALAVDAPDAPIVLDADPNRLVQAIGNLLTNAAKYTPEQGRIGLALRRDGDEAVVEVGDDGIGIPAEALGGLFEMFSQGRHGSSYAQGGLGIGLSLVKRLVEQHGGSVSASSAGAGQGSRFTLRLPIAPGAPDRAGPAPDALPAAADAGSGAARPLRILIADDNRDAAELLAQALQMDGHAVTTVHDGLAALESMAARRPDLALLDIGMPGMDGYRLAEAIRRDPIMGNAVLAAVTGWGSDQDRARARRAGFDHHLTKPVDLDSVTAIVAAVRQRTGTPGR